MDVELVSWTGDGYVHSVGEASVPLTTAETAKVRRMVCWRATRTSDWRCGKRWLAGRSRAHKSYREWHTEALMSDWESMMADVGWCWNGRRVMRDTFDSLSSFN